jgi:ethanolamine utilization protein EutP
MIMLIGPVGAGKTSLLNALQHNCRKAQKTQSICFSSGMIDTPGEYTQMPRFYSSLAVTAVEAKLVIMIQDASDFRAVLPPGFASMFPRPVVGVVTKIDRDGANREKAKERLLQAGVREAIFYVSAHTGEGLAEVIQFLAERGCK